MSIHNPQSHFVKLSNLQLLVGKDSFIATAARAKNNVKQIDANVLNLRSFATAGAMTTSLLKIRMKFISRTVKNYQKICMSIIRITLKLNILYRLDDIYEPLCNFFVSI